MPPAEPAPAEGPDAEDTAAPEVPPPAATPVAGGGDVAPPPVAAVRPNPAMLDILMARGMSEDWSDDRLKWEIQQLALQSVIRERELLRLNSGTLNNWVRQEWGEQFCLGGF